MKPAVHHSPVRLLLPSFWAGLADGLIVPFALLAGGTSIIRASANIVVFVISCTILAALLMAIANYFTRRKERYEKFTPLEEKRMRARRFYANLDLPLAVQEESVTDTLKENEVWDELDHPEKIDSPALSAFITGGGYLLGGLICMLPYFFIDASYPAFRIATIITLPALFFTGLAKNKGNRNALLRALVLVGMAVLAAAAAYWIARFL